jgi:hypothetical protein
VAVRNRYYLPKKSSSAINENMLFNVLNGQYWCPKYDEIKMLPCVKAPIKEVLNDKLQALCQAKGFNIGWIEFKTMPDKDWYVAVIATLNPEDEIFKKDYLAPPIRKRLQDIETIVLPNEVFEGLPKTKSKLKARRLKIVSEAFESEKASRLKEVRKHLDEEILDQEVRVDQYKQLKRQKMSVFNNNMEEEKKGEKKEMIKP